jgi:hypothetical protein
MSRAVQDGKRIGLQRVCEDQDLRIGVPEGRLNLAQDASPGYIMKAKLSPGGTAENRPRCHPGKPSAVPAGLNHASFSEACIARAGKPNLPGLTLYCGGLVVLGRGVVDRGALGVLGRGAAGAPAAGCAGTPDLTL